MSTERQPSLDDLKITVDVDIESEFLTPLFTVIEEQGLSFTAPGTASPAAAISSIQETVAYVGLLGLKLSYIPLDPSLNPDRLSISELEFNEALRLNRPILLFIEEGHDDREPNLETDLEQRKQQDNFRTRVIRLTSDASIERACVVFYGLDDFRVKAPVAIARLRDQLLERAKSLTEISQDPNPPTMVTGFSGVSSPQEAATEPKAPAQKKSTRQKPSPPTPATTAKPLIYFSFDRSSEFYEHLKTELDKYKDEVEWWDDSRIPTGGNLPEELENAINRASLAVILLAPPYLEYRATTDELAHLVEQSNYRGLRLFPIVVYDCAWRELESLKNVQVWGAGEPVGDLHGPEAEREVEKIAKAIVDQARQPIIKPPLPPPDQPPELVFSKDALKVLRQAQSLAMRSHRKGVTSSCLLFALAELADKDQNASRFLRDALERTGGYAAALSEYLSDAASTQPSNIQSRAFGFQGNASKNMVEIFTSAANISYRVSRQPAREISPRHLLAALLVMLEDNAEPTATKRIKKMGIPLSQLCREFLDFIRTRKEVSEDQAGWAAILIAKGFQRGPAGYTSEFCGVGGVREVEDHLNVKDWAHQLAELIALRETRLPLAIGLFGNWGSGKSHFMNLIDRQLKLLTEEERERKDGSTDRWCREIVPIYFNAWHYLDANLWASLVAQIFESLFAHLRPKEDDLEKVQKLLEQASGATARAAEEVTIAQDATVKAQGQLRAAEASRRSNETVIDALLQSLSRLLPEVTPDELQRQAIELLNVQKEVRTLDDLRGVVADVHSLGRLERVWYMVWKQPGRSWRLTWMLTTVTVVPLVSILATIYLPGIREWLQGIGRPIAALLTTISAFLLWARPFVAEANRRVKQLDRWASQAETAQQQARLTPEVITATMNVNAAVATEEAAKLQLAEAQAREKQLKEEALNLVPERRLGRYIEQRAQSADYRGQLGLVSLARRDFQELSDIFADKEALKERVARLQASQKPSETAEADQLQKLSRSIDRIVLFVDDLDRCQPEKVVEILQAVHLLLAFPLFAVVVGVDQRCLRQSLRMQFKGLLTQEPEAENGANDRSKINKGLDDDERPATPLDYLEKIFHVPFHLPPMGETAFETLIDRLTEPKTTVTSTTAGSAPKTEPKQDAGLAAASLNDPELKKQTVPLELTKEEDDNRKVSPEDQAVNKSASHGLPPPGAGATIGVMGSVPLQRWEREALRAYHPLIQTPRGATRLLNTYRLVRAGIPAAEWDEFCGGGLSDGEFRVAMLLLAAAAGYPALAREWFDRLQTTPPAKLFLPEGASESDPAWNQFKKVYLATFAHITMPLTTKLFTKWVNRVERFAF